MYFLFCSCSHSGPANRYCFQWTESVSKASMEVGKRIDYFEYECRERERDKKKGNQLSLNQFVLVSAAGSNAPWLLVAYTHFDCVPNECRCVELEKRFIIRCECETPLDTIKCDAQPWHHLGDYSILDTRIDQNFPFYHIQKREFFGIFVESSSLSFFSIGTKSDSLVRTEFLLP